MTLYLIQQLDNYFIVFRLYVRRPTVSQVNLVPLYKCIYVPNGVGWEGLFAACGIEVHFGDDLIIFKIAVQLY